ncbi:hypothetical protein DPMN_159316 [Dreissena polymorpha]|uniref:Uncharacterized protein n=1 Tax=Dreissena polymorpha TaxID=45954 RepID=A0A9D4EKV6_DREPO|nr:hypothetical protein DPMN_159316 [Dreissena polymorpha]
MYIDSSSCKVDIGDFRAHMIPAGFTASKLKVDKENNLKKCQYWRNKASCRVQTLNYKPANIV